MTSALIISVFLVTSLQAAPSSRGAAPASEAQVLWSEGKKAYESGDCKEAIRNLRRLVDRHPGTANGIDARGMLGRCYLRTGSPAEAIPFLKAYSSTRGTSLEGWLGRVDLGRAYLEAGKTHEALLEVHAATTAKVSKEIQARALILKAQTHLFLKENLKAEKALSSARKSLSETKDLASDTLKHMQSEISYLELALKARICERLGVQNPLAEGHVLGQMQRRGLCLEEAAVQFRKLAETGLEPWISRARDLMDKAFAAYQRAADAPPNPPGRFSASELKKYKTELSERLVREVEAARKRIGDL